MPHDPGMAASVLGAASALLALVAMTRVACMDLQRFMIDLDWAELAGWSGLGAIIALEGPDGWARAVGVATLAGGLAWLATRLRPSRFGQGDVAVCAVLGIVSGTHHGPFVMALVIAFILAAVVAYGLARGKGLFGSGIPYALPAMAAAGPAFAWRVAAGIRPESVPQGLGSAVLIASAGTVLLSCGLAAGALPMALRRRAAAQAAGSDGHQGRSHQPEQPEET